MGNFELLFFAPFPISPKQVLTLSLVILYGQKKRNMSYLQWLSGLILSKLEISFVTNNRKLTQKSLKLLSWAVFPLIRQTAGGGQPRADTAAPGCRQVLCAFQSHYS